MSENGCKHVVWRQQSNPTVRTATCLTRCLASVIGCKHAACRSALNVFYSFSLFRLFFPFSSFLPSSRLPDALVPVAVADCRYCLLAILPIAMTHLLPVAIAYCHDASASGCYCRLSILPVVVTLLLPVAIADCRYCLLP